MTPFISPANKELCNWVEKISGIDATQIRRMIIDISVDSAVMIYIEKMASVEMLDLEIPSKLLDDGVKITVLDKE